MSGDAALATSAGRGSARVGFVVSKAVGNAVTRTRVKRRLRHAVRPHVASLPHGSVLVVRAQAAAGSSSYQELDGDLGRCLQRVLATTGSGQEER